ncbi:MAG: hypothetical protein E6G42_10150 [Actinobacteria bacterium]|nr:MAG: hypothetical protein E6G42_10150 [Actinomycetota bacterium]
MRPPRTRARVELLQWFGLLGGAAAWTCQHATLFILGVARCNPAGSHWGAEIRGWQIGVTIGAAVVAGAAEAAAIATALRTREVEHEGPPPLGRIHFFALAASAGNLLFLGAILLDGIGTTWWSPCGQG